MTHCGTRMPGSSVVHARERAIAAVVDHDVGRHGLGVTRVMKTLPLTLYSSIVWSPSARCRNLRLDSISAMVPASVGEEGGSGGGSSSGVVPGGRGRGVDWPIAMRRTR
jgi:hypothetical protein